MRRKNRKWVAIAVFSYLLLMFSAYRWSVNQRIPEGNIFVRIERAASQEHLRRLAQTEKEQAPPSPTGQSRLNAAGPAYVAARYDATHVVFIVTNDAESRFSGPVHSSAPTRISASAKPSAPLAGLQELWEPSPESIHFYPKIIQTIRAGDQWIMSISPDSTIPVTIERVIIAPTGCSLALGFLASIPEDHARVFNSSAQDYFVVRHDVVESADPPVTVPIAEITNWNASPLAAKQIEQQLTSRMKQEVAAIDARLLANAASPGVQSLPLPVGDARPRLKEWLHADKGLVRDEGLLEYDLHAFRLTPDGNPRLFVRARWTLAGATTFVMTAWFEAAPNSADAAPTLLWDDSSWSEGLREGEAPVSLGDHLDFQTILNEFDADRDGWAELLIHSYDAHVASGQRTSTTIALYLYTDSGLVPMKTSLHRTIASADTCLDR